MKCYFYVKFWAGLKFNIKITLSTAENLTYEIYVKILAG